MFNLDGGRWQTDRCPANGIAEIVAVVRVTLLYRFIYLHPLIGQLP